MALKIKPINKMLRSILTVTDSVYADDNYFLLEFEDGSKLKLKLDEKSSLEIVK
jgi:hypothetical protein